MKHAPIFPQTCKHQKSIKSTDDVLQQKQAKFVVLIILKSTLFEINPHAVASPRILNHLMPDAIFCRAII